MESGSNIEIDFYRYLSFKLHTEIKIQISYKARGECNGNFTQLDITFRYFLVFKELYRIESFVSEYLRQRNIGCNVGGEHRFVNDIRRPAPLPVRLVLDGKTRHTESYFIFVCAVFGLKLTAEL